jgi:hypothetical protein
VYGTAELHVDVGIPLSDINTTLPSGVVIIGAISRYITSLFSLLALCRVQDV